MLSYLYCSTKTNLFVETVEQMTMPEHKPGNYSTKYKLHTAAFLLKILQDLQEDVNQYAVTSEGGTVVVG